MKSKDEAIEWLKRAPFDDTEVEIRQVFEAEDSGAELTPELRDQEGRLRKQVAKKPNSFAAPGYCQDTKLYDFALRPRRLRLRIDGGGRVSNNKNRNQTLKKFCNAQ